MKTYDFHTRVDFPNVFISGPSVVNVEVVMTLIVPEYQKQFRPDQNGSQVIWKRDPGRDRE